MSDMNLIRTILDEEPLIVHGIRRDIARNPQYRGGTLHFRPGTVGYGGSGCPGDNLTEWIDRLREAAGLGPAE